MTKRDSTYQNTKVGIPQGADRLDIDSDGLLDFFGVATVTGDALKKILYDNQQQTIIRSSNTVLSTSNLPQNGIVFLRLSVGCSNISAWLVTPSVGDELTIVVQNFLIESVLSVRISTSLCSIVGRHFSNAANLCMHTSANSEGWVKIKCFTAGEWTVVGGNRQFDEVSV
jgi:hypothetical protein